MLHPLQIDNPNILNMSGEEIQLCTSSNTLSLCLLPISMFHIIYCLYAHHNRSPCLILFSTRPVLLRLANTRTEQNDVAVYLQTVSWGACFQSRLGYQLS